MRRKFALILVAAMLLTTIQAAPVEAKSKGSVKFTNLNSNIVVPVGKTYKTKIKRTGSYKKSRVRYKSSNTNIAIVSRKGIIKGKKAGTVKITVYLANHKKVKHTVTVRVGTRVSGIKVSGRKYIKVGSTFGFTRSTTPSNAMNRSVRWSSSNSKVLRYVGNGEFKGIKAGTATVTAKAKDGSGKKATMKVTVFSSIKKSDLNGAHPVAHRGIFSGNTKENTARAFKNAANAGFWAAECDVHTTKRLTEEEANAINARNGYGSITSQSIDEPDSDNALIDERAGNAMSDSTMAIVTGEGLEISDDGTQIDDDIVSIAEEVNIDPMDEAEEILPDDDSAEMELSTEDGSMAALEQSDEDDGLVHAGDFEIVINHDTTFNRIYPGREGSTTATTKMTADYIRETFPEVCFLDEYIRICKSTGMTPVIELKGSAFSEDATHKVIDLLAKYDMLEDARIIGFHLKPLQHAKKYGDSEYPEASIYYFYLINKSSSSNYLASAQAALDAGLDGIDISPSVMAPTIASFCRKNGLTLNLATYGSHSYTNLMNDLYAYHPNMVTMNAKLFSGTAR